MSGALIDPEPLALFPLVRGALICDGGAIPGAALLFPSQALELKVLQNLSGASPKNHDLDQQGCFLWSLEVGVGEKTPLYCPGASTARWDGIWFHVYISVPGIQVQVCKLSVLQAQAPAGVWVLVGIKKTFLTPALLRSLHLLMAISH